MNCISTGRDGFSPLDYARPLLHFVSVSDPSCSFPTSSFRVRFRPRLHFVSFSSRRGFVPFSGKIPVFRQTVVEKGRHVTSATLSTTTTQMHSHMSRLSRLAGLEVDVGPHSIRRMCVAAMMGTSGSPAGDGVKDGVLIPFLRRPHDRDTKGSFSHDWVKVVDTLHEHIQVSSDGGFPTGHATLSPASVLLQPNRCCCDRVW